MQLCTKFFFIIPYLYEAQHVSGDTPSIIRSLKLPWQPLVFHRWKVVGRVVGGHCQAHCTMMHGSTNIKSCAISPKSHDHRGAHCYQCYGTYERDLCFFFFFFLGGGGSLVNMGSHCSVTLLHFRYCWHPHKGYTESDMRKSYTLHVSIFKDTVSTA